MQASMLENILARRIPSRKRLSIIQARKIAEQVKGNYIKHPEKRGYDPIQRSKILNEIFERYKNLSIPTLDVSKVDNQYSMYINDDSVINPFIINPDIIKEIKHITKDITDPDALARKIFSWELYNIDYGKSKRKNGYKNSSEVLKDKEGVCGEMSYLYIVMTRAVGLKSSFVFVDVDYKGKEVSHACAVVDLNPKRVFVDVAYRTYGILHQRYSIMKDIEVLNNFNYFRN